MGLHISTIKETRMKKNFVLMAAGILLAAGLVFTACSSDDPGGEAAYVPAPGDLPDLPDDGPSYVTSENAKTLLDGLYSSGLYTIRNNVENLTYDAGQETNDGYTWDITDNTTLKGLKVNSQGSSTEVGKLIDFFWGEDFFNPEKGDYMEESENHSTTIEFIEDKITSRDTIYAKSRIDEQGDYYYKVTMTEFYPENRSGTANMNTSKSSSYGYGFTVSHGGIGGKIIFEASVQGSIKRDNIQVDYKFGPTDYYEEDLSRNSKYSGSLKVYGAEDELVYTEIITSRNEFDALAVYFGI
jgi:hypothetical protein